MYASAGLVLPQIDFLAPGYLSVPGPRASMSVPSMVHRPLFGTNDAVIQQSTDKDLPECKVKRNYSCGSCDFFTQNPRSYLYHQRDVHNEKVRIYECPNCLYASKHFQKLLRHTKMVHNSADSAEVTKKAPKRPIVTSEEESNESPPSCDEDDPKPPSPSDPKTNLKCSLCSFTAKSHVQLTKHESEKHIKTKFFRCTKCTYVTHMKARFTKHVKYHSMPMIKCDMCDFRTPYKWNLDRHCKNHNGRGAFRCSACNFTADIKQSLTVHEMNHHVPPVGQAAGLGVGRRRNKVGASDTTAAEEAANQVQNEPEQCEPAPRTATAPKIKVLAKKAKSGANGQDGGSDFVHPDDIVHHANGNVYIKSKCKHCNFKTAWDGEMARHEERAHGSLSLLSSPKKKPSRPVPNLIPISPQKQPRLEPTMSQKDINEICARSANSALRDFASLFGSEDVFPPLCSTPKEPDNKRKKISILDSMNESLSGEASEILTCRHCGHESKCLTEAYSHQKSCGKEAAPSLSMTSVHNLSSTRCQHCRQRCKSSKDLLNHLITCPSAAKFYAQEEPPKPPEEDNSSSEKDHPMVNKVFVWNNIEVPMDIELDEPNHYEFVDDKQEDNVSIDLSIRTQSPSSECSNIEIAPPITTTPQTFDKIPTHGNDISVAQHKRVFKCPHCTFWASTASRFHVHIVGHLNKKPFECSLCAYRSNWRWDITKHIKLKSVRDPAHENAKVLMTDETGRRNYTKYNKYLTEIHMNGGSDNQETSGGMGTRPKHQDAAKTGRSPGEGANKSGALRPPPALKAADEFFNRVASEKKKVANDGKKTLWQCKKCNFRDANREKLLEHVKGHYPQTTTAATTSPSPSSPLSGQPSATASPSTTAASPSPSGIGGQRCPNTGDDADSEASVGGGGPVRGQAPFRCGHCHQVSNWKHVIQRHCRLKHSGDIKVIVAAKNLDKSDTEPLPEELVDVREAGVQLGQYKCNQCPFSSDDVDDYQSHKDGHTPSATCTIKCFFCNFFVSQKDDLYAHLVLHDMEPKKRYKCAICPYVTNSKSQFMYHKQFHKPKNGQYGCSECSYNVSKRHLLHQHMKVHGISMSPHKQNGDTIDMEEISDEIEEVPQQTCDWQQLPEIPLVWVSKAGKFSKMYKCRYCPHVNLRKVNIQEHEKMHGSREKNPARGNDVEHHCPDCNYVCNNAGVLSSHSKVHQGLYGVVHGLVDCTKSDEEQIRELGQLLSASIDAPTPEDDPEKDGVTLNFCPKCPARFLKEAEYEIHAAFHGANLAHRCDHCSYTARQRPHLMAHAKVHTKEYQERSRFLIETCRINPDNPPPEITQTSDAYIVDDDETERTTTTTTTTTKMNIPISGTELFQQKSEAEGTYYSDCMRNGRPKRHRCPKCPAVFERLESFKSHLVLHGSRQQYRCTKCDFAVKGHGDFLLHEKVHQQEALLDVKMEDEDVPSDLTMKKEPTSPTEDKKMFWCSMCPYMNHRKDALDSHQKRHIAVSGSPSSYTCQHCDYSVPQVHFLRDHTKLHFQPNRLHVPDAYMNCDYMKLSARLLPEDDSPADEPMIFDIKSDNYEQPLQLNINNNEDEKVYVSMRTGDFVGDNKDTAS